LGGQAPARLGIDDGSRFVVVSAVVAVQSGRAVTEALHAIADGALAGTRPCPDGRIMVNKQPTSPGPATPESSSPSSSKTPATASCTARKNSPGSPRKDTSPINRLYVRGMKTQA
jgi:hypothetical protein